LINDSSSICTSSIELLKKFGMPDLYASFENLYDFSSSTLLIFARELLLSLSNLRFSYSDFIRPMLLFFIISLYGLLNVYLLANFSSMKVCYSMIAPMSEKHSFLILFISHVSLIIKLRSSSHFYISFYISNGL
jgi:hypothetical protein